MSESEKERDKEIEKERERREGDLLISRQRVESSSKVSATQ